MRLPTPAALGLRPLIASLGMLIPFLAIAAGALVLIGR